MKKPFTLEASFLGLQEDNAKLKRRLEKLETWEPNIPRVGMQVVLSGNYAYTTSPAIVTVPLDTVYYDTHDAFDATSYTFTAPFDGRYLAIGRVKSSGGVGIGSLIVQHTTTNYRAALDYVLGCFEEL